MYVIGTAGHVDHGKSRLILALTGTDPDRLAEEKLRGMTIDLGFASMTLPSGEQIGIIDVPGHERFIRNMLAGAGTINVCLFVVAANEGWKPQSQEHLEILDLLGLTSAVVALTKSDTVDEDMVQEIREQVRRRLAGTAIADVPIVAVSAETGEGVSELVAELQSVIESTPPPPDVGHPWMWIDRVFTMHGSGTVVTGTLAGSGLRKDQEVMILPAGTKARIRGIQSHNRQLDSVEQGNRVALNLTGIGLQDLRRGDVVTLPSGWTPTALTDRFLVHLRFLPGFEPTSKGAFKVYVGSAEYDAKVAFLESPDEETAPVYSVVTLSRPAPPFWDRFILREAGRRRTVGGGTLISPFLAADHPNSKLKEMVPDIKRAIAEGVGLLIPQGGMVDAHQVAGSTGMDLEQAVAVSGAVLLGETLMSRELFEKTRQHALALLREHHLAHPLDPGHPRLELRNKLGLPPQVFDAFVGKLKESSEVVADLTFLRMPEHKVSPSGPEHDALLDALNVAGASPPPMAELAARFGADLVRAMIRQQELVQISPDIVYAADWIEGLHARIKDHVDINGPFTVAEFRDLIGTTRKYAVPLLEWLDQAGFTRRDGDLRVLGSRA